MKKGCFVKIIVVLTIFVAVALYLIQNYGYKIKEMVLSKGKEKLKEYFIDKYSTHFAYVKPSPERDSLEFYMKKYFEKNFSNVKNLNDESEEKIDNFFESVGDIISDSVITKSEFDKIKELANE